MTQVATVADWAPRLSVSLLTRLVSFTRSAFVMTVVENPLTWKLGIRGSNEMDDIEGPFYILGAPQRQIEDGKAVMASTEYLKKYGPFLFIFEVKDEKGEPVPHATLDWWQADTDGGYYFASWTLRGKVTTDANGRVEVLSVRPGDYGNKLLGERAGHVHLIVNGTKGKHRAMTTQAYICPGNRSEHMMKDVYVLSIRAESNTKADDGNAPSRPINMATCYSIPAANGGEKYWELPELPADDTETASRVSWWNAKLKERGVDRQVLGVGRHELKLSTL
ncbi:aromatic compound dioxygenase [Trametes sanguinea]|nr:aromatic compound dioxygenase [Trametes sanguinea]